MRDGLRKLLAVLIGLRAATNLGKPFGGGFVVFGRLMHGAAATVALIAGFMRGLFGFGCFFATLYVGLAQAPAGLAYAAAWAAALAMALLLHGLRRRRGPPG